MDDTRNSDNIFSIDDVLGMERDPTTNTITLSIGNALQKEPNQKKSEMWQAPGLISIPAPFKTGGTDCNQAISISRPDLNITIAQRDVRYQSLYANLKEGETCLYAAGTGEGQARILLKQDNSINMFTKADAGSKGIGQFINPADDSITLVNSKGYGVIINADGVTLTTGKATVKVGGDGTISIIATQAAQIDGSSIVIGSTASPATPMLLGLTGIAGLASTKIFGSIA